MKNSTLWLIVGGFALLAIGGGEALMGDKLTVDQLITLAANAGFTGGDLVTAVAIALAESGGNPMAHGDTTLGSGRGSFGLWQIYSDAHPEFGPDFTVLYDPVRNAAAAFDIYKKAGHSFMPWSTYKFGQYTKYVPSVTDTMEA